jgi:hypothetical protein
MRTLDNLARDRTQNRLPLLLIALSHFRAEGKSEGSAKPACHLYE